MTTPKRTGAKRDAPRLKNMYSEASEASIFDAIRKELVAHKAKRLLFDYDEDGRATGIEFTLEIGNAALQFRLPARFAQAEPILEQARRASRHPMSRGDTLKEQTYRAVWATIRDWISAQMALIDVGAVRTEEVFLPYLVLEEGKTMFEQFAVSRALPAPRTVIREE